MTYIRNQDPRTNPIISLTSGAGLVSLVLPPNNVSLAGSMSVDVLPRNLVAALPTAIKVTVGDTTLLPTLAGSITVAVSAQPINLELC